MKVELLASLTKISLLSLFFTTPALGEDTILWIKSNVPIRVAVNEHYKPDPDIFHKIHHYKWDCWPKNTYSNMKIRVTDRLGRVKEKVVCLKDGETEIADFAFPLENPIKPIPEPEPTIPEPEPTIPEPEPTIPEPEPTIPEPEPTIPEPEPTIPEPAVRTTIPKPEMAHYPRTEAFTPYVQQSSWSNAQWVLIGICIFLLLIIICWLTWLTNKISKSM